MRDAGHRTPDAGHRTSDGEKSKNNISTPQGGGHNYAEHLTKVVFGKFICANKVFIFKTALILRRICGINIIF